MLTRTAPTIPRRDSFPLRNLIYHVYADRANDVWRANVWQITKRWGLFTGRKVIAVATGPQSHSLYEVRCQFGDLDAEFLHVQNDPRLRETATFGPLLRAVADSPPAAVTFYSHTKGNTTEQSSDGKMPEPQRLRGATRWRNAMYHHLLDRWPTVKAALGTAAAVGTTQMEGGFTYPSGLTFGNGFWQFAGTFFWFRNDVIFGLPNWSEISPDRYGAEAWLGSLLPASAVQSAFQPWPPTRWPTGSPYSPTHYGKEFDDV